MASSSVPRRLPWSLRPPQEFGATLLHMLNMIASSWCSSTCCPPATTTPTPAPRDTGQPACRRDPCAAVAATVATPGTPYGPPGRRRTPGFRSHEQSGGGEASCGPFASMSLIVARLSMPGPVPERSGGSHVPPLSQYHACASHAHGSRPISQVPMHHASVGGGPCAQPMRAEEVLSWSCTALACGRRPTHRHDGTAFEGSGRPGDDWRASVAQERLRLKGCVLQIRGCLGSTPADCVGCPPPRGAFGGSCASTFGGPARNGRPFSGSCALPAGHHKAAGPPPPVCVPLMPLQATGPTSGTPSHSTAGTTAPGCATSAALAPHWIFAIPPSRHRGGTRASRTRSSSRMQDCEGSLSAQCGSCLASEYTTWR